METARTSCMVLIIVAGAVMFGHFLARTGIPYALAGWLSPLPLPAFMIIGVIIVFYLIAGCFIDALAIVLLTVPIFTPVVMKLGYDPIWFGVIIVVVTQMGVISPPVGVNVYVVSGMERDIPLEHRLSRRNAVSLHPDYRGGHPHRVPKHIAFPALSYQVTQPITEVHAMTSESLPPSAYQRILFCTDFSENAGFAFDYAVDAAVRRPGSTLYLFHVVPEPDAQFWKTYIYEVEGVDEKAKHDIDAKVAEQYLPRVPAQRRLPRRDASRPRLLQNPRIRPASKGRPHRHRPPRTQRARKSPVRQRHRKSRPQGRLPCPRGPPERKTKNRRISSAGVPPA